MADSTARRRGHGEDAIYFDAAKNRYAGAVSLGFGPDGKRKRRKVTGRTRQEVRDKLRALHAELDRGLRTSSAYTVQKAVDDWLAGGLPGRSERTRSVYREALTPLMGQTGNKPLRDLTAGDVRGGLEALGGRLSTRYLQIAKAALARAIGGGGLLAMPGVLGQSTRGRIRCLVTAGDIRWLAACYSGFL